MTTTKKDVSGANIDANAPDGLTVTESEAKKARHDGALDAVKDAAKDARVTLTDGAQPGEPAVDRYQGSDESQMYAHMIEMGVDAFEDRVSKKPKDQNPITDTQAAGLLKLERNGQNRTPYVKALMNRLGLKGKEDLHSVAKGGPDYTNAIDSLDDL